MADARRPVPPAAIRYPPELPVTARRGDLLAAIRDHQVVVVAGETGSGKSTQLPKLCLELGRGVDGLIGHTQPRRIAARAVAERVAEELGTEVGGLVGYAVRFTDTVRDETLLKVMTDGILLAEIQRDRDLRRYDTLIIDEAHERSLNIDFILGYVRRLLPRRPDLKVIITSATIDTERFAAHFDDAPVVEVSGRTYPVEVRYRPLVVETDGEVEERDQIQGICDAIDEVTREGPGDILVFLSGEREIHDTAGALADMALPDTEVVPLYARLSAAEQHRVFAPHRGRRIVLATNVAETSLTVPGIRYVIDPGTARISRYGRRTKVQRLPIEPVSQASADQRAGRCGRIGPGVCIRLYSEEDFLSRPEYTEPEILRTNLASVILQMAAIGLGDVARFPFVDPPDARAVADGVALLQELGALDGTQRLTKLGRRLARLPLDPRLGRMVIEAERHGCVREAMIIAAALSIQDPRERPSDQQQAADELHARFAHPDSDFLSYLSLWTYLRERQRELSSSQFRKMCRAEHLNYLRVREWQDIFSQLRQVAGDVGVHVGSAPGDPDAIHLALLSGLLSHIGMRDGERREYRGARGTRFAITPGSTLFRTTPRWVMAAELVETTRLWARTVARIRPEWAEQAGAHLVKRSYSEPAWDAARGAAVTQERVTLYGLPVVASRTVPYSRVDPDEARAMFIQHALVEGDWRTHHPFLEENKRLLAEVSRLADRLRRTDVVVDDGALFDFYDQRVGRDVVSGRHFDAWWKRARQRQPRLLSFTPEMLLRPAARGWRAEDYPDEWRQGSLSLRLSYRFEPGAEDDGVTVHVPLSLVNQVTGEGFDWHIPAHREDLVTELIRGLPKAVRRAFVPAPDHARAFLDAHGPEDGPLLPTLARFLTLTTGESIPPGSWDVDALPGHLRLRFAVESDRGTLLVAGRDLGALRARVGGNVRAAIARATPGIERTGQRSWTFGEIPRSVEATRAGNTVVGYPALVDEGETVGVRVFASPAEQARAMRAGTRRLLLLTVPSPRKPVLRVLSTEAKLAIAHNPHGSVAAFLDDCITCAVDHLLETHGGPRWDEEGFDDLRRAVDGKLVETVLDVVATAVQILGTAASVEDRIDRLTAPALQPALVDMATQVARLVYRGFVAAAGADRLPDVVRYLRGVERRLERLPSDVARDRVRMERVRRLEAAWEQARAAAPPGADEEVQRARWLLEELRVSLFAQSLGTAVPVSEERVERAISGIWSQ